MSDELHRAVGNQEQDVANGKIAGYCLLCQKPYPCEYIKSPALIAENADLTAKLKELEAENARLKKEVAAANKGAKTNALVNQGLSAKLMIALDDTAKLKLAVEALEQIRDSDVHTAIEWVANNALKQIGE